jgi:hypothetical protein
MQRCENAHRAGVGAGSAFVRCNSGVNHTPCCPVCGISTQGDLCRVCAAWREHYKHTQSAVKALDAITKRPSRGPVRGGRL